MYIILAAGHITESFSFKSGAPPARVLPQTVQTPGVRPISLRSYALRGPRSPWSLSQIQNPPPHARTDTHITHSLLITSGH